MKKSSTDLKKGDAVYEASASSKELSSIFSRIMIVEKVVELEYPMNYVIIEWKWEGSNSTSFKLTAKDEEWYVLVDPFFRNDK